MQKITISVTLLAVFLLSGCEPVNTPDSVMFSTKNEKIDTAAQAS